MRYIFTKKYIYYILFILIFLIGCFFRLNLFLNFNDASIDEAQLTFNILSRSYKTLFLPLRYSQVAPPIFLVLSKFVYSIFPLHPTITFSDILLRIVPLLSGIISIPCFGYLLNKLFKNRIMTLLGMFLLAISPSCVTFSTVFKQYSFELLILILVLILFTKVDFQNKSLRYNFTLSVLLSLSLFCSMTAVYSLVGGFIYLILNIKNKNQFKQFIICSIGFALIFIVYVSKIILPVYITHFKFMHGYWNGTFSFTNNIYEYLNVFLGLMYRTDKYPNILSIIFIISVLLMLIKQFKIMVLALSPIVITFLFIHFQHYPFAERLLIFLVPCSIVFLIYPITLLPYKLYFNKKNVYIAAAIVLFLGTIYAWHGKNLSMETAANSRIVWKYFLSHYQDDGVVLHFPFEQNIRYYNRLTKNVPLEVFNNTFIQNCPAGTYYIVSSRFNSSNRKKFDEFSKNIYEILEFKKFEGEQVYDNKLYTIAKRKKKKSFFYNSYDGIYMKFKIN